MDSICFGTYRLLGDKCYDIVKQAIRIGYRTIDTADLYKNHKEVGRAIRDVIVELGIKRSDIVVISKIHNRNQKKCDVYDSCKRIVSELDIDYVDIMLLHSPVRGKFVLAYSELIKIKNEKIIKHIGVSNFDINDLIILMENGYVPYMNQIELSIFGQRNKLIEFCKSNGNVVQAHSCLTNGIKFNNEQLAKIVAKLNITVMDLMILWCIHMKVSVTIGSSNIDHIKNNIDLLKIDPESLITNNVFDELVKLNESFFIYSFYISK